MLLLIVFLVVSLKNDDIGRARRRPHGFGQGMDRHGRATGFSGSGHPGDSIPLTAIDPGECVRDRERGKKAVQIERQASGTLAEQK